MSTQFDTLGYTGISNYFHNNKGNAFDKFHETILYVKTGLKLFILHKMYKTFYMYTVYKNFK